MFPTLTDLRFVLLDLTMPIMSAEENAPETAGHPSGHSGDSHQRLQPAGRRPAISCEKPIQKPFTAAELTEKVQTVLARSGR